MCSQEIKNEFNLEKAVSKNFDKLVAETIEQYGFWLAESLGTVQGRNKEDLIKVLQALYYYKKQNSKAEEFDRMMTVLDYEEA